VNRVLLDTNHLIFAVQRPEKLSRTAANILNDQTNRLLVSTVSLLEIAAKNRSRRSDGSSKLPLPSGLAAFARFVGSTRAVMIDLTAGHVMTELTQEPSHGDPFDYVLLQQAQAEGATLLTSDRTLRDHPLVTYAKPS
jgi:PIN domain nuclease of toxin-antitoxin system